MHRPFASAVGSASLIPSTASTDARAEELCDWLRDTVEEQAVRIDEVLQKLDVQPAGEGKDE